MEVRSFICWRWLCGFATSSSARRVRGLGAGVEVGAAAPGISFVWWLALVARATWSSTRWVRGLGAGVEVGAAAPEISCALGVGFGL